MKYLAYIGVALTAGCLAGCGAASPRFTFANNVKANLGGSYSEYEEGVASYYAEEFNGRKTSNGEIYDMNALTAAHRTIPFNSKVRVTNTNNNKSVIVRINDRGPFKDNRIIDLSLEAAKEIQMIGTGTAAVQLRIIELGDTVNTK
jgi:rare lipoprotein A